MLLGSSSMPATLVLTTTSDGPAPRSISRLYTVASSSCGWMPRPTDRAPCGSKSTSRTRRPNSARAAPRLIVVVVLPTPPFWLQTATTRAGPCLVSGSGWGKTGRGRPVGPVTSSATRDAATMCCTSQRERRKPPLEPGLYGVGGPAASRLTVYPPHRCLSLPGRVGQRGVPGGSSPRGNTAQKALGWAAAYTSRSLSTVTSV